MSYYTDDEVLAIYRARSRPVDDPGTDGAGYAIDISLAALRVMSPTYVKAYLAVLHREQVIAHPVDAEQVYRAVGLGPVHPDLRKIAELLGATIRDLSQPQESTP